MSSRSGLIGPSLRHRCQRALITLVLLAGCAIGVPTVAEAAPLAAAVPVSSAAAPTAVYGQAAGAAVVKAKDGTWRSFAVGANGQIYQQIKNGSWGAPESLGGSFKAGPAVLYRAVDHHFDVFAVSTGGVVMQKTFASGRWSGWISTGVRGFVRSLSAVRDTAGNVHLFGTGGGGRVIQSIHIAGGRWGGNQDLGGPVRGNVAVVYQPGPHRFDLFAVATNGTIRQKTYLGGWSGWRSVSKNGFSGGIAAVRISNTQWRVLGIGTNAQTYQVAFASGHWRAPSRLGGAAIGAPAAFWTAGSGMLLVTGTDDRLHERTIDRPCCSWNPLPGAVYPKVAPPPPPVPTRVQLAKTLLARWGGRLTGLPGVLSDLKATAAGHAIKNSSSCNRTVYLDEKMLRPVVAATNRYKVLVNNMVTGHGCGSGYHPKGMAVDFNTVVDPATGRSTNWHSGTSGDNIALDDQFLTYTAAYVSQGGGAGQRYCAGRTGATLPAGMLFFDDVCNHQHLDTRP